MAAIHDLIEQIADPRLRDRIGAEWSNVAKNKKFGLVFEDHLPELLPLYNMKPQRGDLVSTQEYNFKDIWKVIDVKGDKAVCSKASDQTHPSDSENRSPSKEFLVSELLVVKEFGEPIFPSLSYIDSVANSDKNSQWHTLIEADNYHALQMLDYLYAGQVDCIYIDPPYNTGAKDWKYNNDYVDSNDGWRHSKWLAFMNKRLELAKRLLNPINSVLVVAIDDNELFSLGLLLDEIFNGCDRQIIDITINPKGKARDGRLSQVDEYLIVVYLGEAVALPESCDTKNTELRWPYLRRSDVESARGTKKGGVRQFYPIYVDKTTGRIKLLGEPLTPEQDLSEAPDIDGCEKVFPIRDDGKHMNWGLTTPSLQKALDQDFVRVAKSKNTNQSYNIQYVTAPSIEKIKQGLYVVSGTRPDGSKIVVIPEGKEIRATTSWKKNTYDANAYGSKLIGGILNDEKFSFPKSLYAVFDTLKVFLGKNKEALIVDFFAGSGTTLHATNLLNAIDNGNRRCILVTNNEVSVAESELLSSKGMTPNDMEWQEKGICRSITWPRNKNSILGRKEDGTSISGEYLTGKTVEMHRKRKFNHISFITSDSLNTPVKKKQLVGLIEGLPQSLVKKEPCPYIISDKYTSSIIFDIDSENEYLESLDGQEHITEFYIVAESKKRFDSIKERVTELLGPIKIAEEVKRPMSEGFSANLAYFKLDFLDKNSVALGLSFKEIIPLLWLKSGAVGPCPSLVENNHYQNVFAPKDNNFIVLLDETRLGNLNRLLSEREELSHVFIVTDADESFKTLAEEIREIHSSNHPHLQVLQLYRDYLQNFMINKQQDRASRLALIKGSRA